MINYQKSLEGTLAQIQSQPWLKPNLLLHCCCAPCSSYVFEYLSPYFNITAFFYNPNISSADEYDLRLCELRRLICEMPGLQKVNLIEGNYASDSFFRVSCGLESLPEGSSRCFKCYHLRLLRTAEVAQKLSFDYFSTTLTISPYKNAEKINALGRELSSEFGVKYLFSDFKKNNGYSRSIELSRKYNLYRQNYCGCKFSKKDN